MFHLSMRMHVKQIYTIINLNTMIKKQMFLLLFTLVLWRTALWLNWWSSTRDRECLGVPWNDRNVIVCVHRCTRKQDRIGIRQLIGKTKWTYKISAYTFRQSVHAKTISPHMNLEIQTTKGHRNQLIGSELDNYWGKSDEKLQFAQLWEKCGQSFIIFIVAPFSGKD